MSQALLATEMCNSRQQIPIKNGTHTMCAALHYRDGQKDCPRLRDSASGRGGEFTQPWTNFFGQLSSVWEGRPPFSLSSSSQTGSRNIFGTEYFKEEFFSCD